MHIVSIDVVQFNPTQEEAKNVSHEINSMNNAGQTNQSFKKILVEDHGDCDSTAPVS